MTETKQTFLVILGLLICLVFYFLGYQDCKKEERLFPWLDPFPSGHYRYKCSQETNGKFFCSSVWEGIEDAQDYHSNCYQANLETYYNKSFIK